MNPVVSVIVPAFNAAKYLAAALQTVLGQGVEDAQIIVVDDGSTDDTPRVISGFGGRIQALRQYNRGPASARNAGLNLALGEYVTFIDADDLWPDGRLAHHLAHMRCNPDTDVLLGALQHIRDTDAGWIACGTPFHAMSLPSAMFRRELFGRIGGLDESLRFCEDVDWFFRARRAGVTLRNTPEIGLYHRRHGENLTRHRESVREYTLRVLARHRRARAGSQA